MFYTPHKNDEQHDPENFRTLFPDGVTVLRVDPVQSDGCYDNDCNADTALGRAIHIGGYVLMITPWAGGWYHGGEFDTDGEWPQAGDTLFAVETTRGKTERDDGEPPIEWSAIRLISSRGDMRAVVRDYGDNYNYGADLTTVLRKQEHRAHVDALNDVMLPAAQREMDQRRELKFANDNFDSLWHVIRHRIDGKHRHANQ